jgi:hypothetical protein
MRRLSPARSISTFARFEARDEIGARNTLRRTTYRRAKIPRNVLFGFRLYSSLRFRSERTVGRVSLHRFNFNFNSTETYFGCWLVCPTNPSST